MVISSLENTLSNGCFGICSSSPASGETKVGAQAQSDTAPILTLRRGKDPDYHLGIRNRPFSFSRGVRRLMIRSVECT
jgi:hypothetical protein